MSLSIQTRPTGYKRIGESRQASIDNAAGFARFTDLTAAAPNPLVYIKSSVIDYCGFWTAVSAGGPDEFYIRAIGSTINESFIVGTTVEYWDVESHEWLAAHNPVLYKLKSTLWPTNTVDSTRTVTANQNDNGYTKLTLSGDIKATGTAEDLEFVKLNVIGVGERIYQILTWFSDTSITIDLPYSAGYSFGNIQYYYNNYHARVRVYAGIDSSHPLTAFKPMALICELKQVPDSNGVVTVNISDKIIQAIEVFKNNLQLATLSNNIDAWCNFYITYAESYSKSNGYTLQENLSSYTSDSSNFKASVNAKIAFKNVYPGMMSDYVSNDRKFLTEFSELHFWDGFYSDVSFICDQSGGYQRLVYTDNEYIYDDVGSFPVEPYPSPPDSTLFRELGVHRVQLVRVNNNDSEVISLREPSEELVGPGILGLVYNVISEFKTVVYHSECYAFSINMCWLNHLGGFDWWLFTSAKDEAIDILDTTKSTVNIFDQYPESYNEFADTIDYETSRKSKNKITVRAENLTAQQVRDVSGIRKSSLVQIVNSIYDRRTVIVDDSSFTILKESDKIFSMEFDITYTDEIPNQSL